MTTPPNHNTADQSGADREKIAQAIYDAFEYTGAGTKPTWWRIGNSQKQDEARKYADAALAALASTHPAPSNAQREGMGLTARQAIAEAIAFNRSNFAQMTDEDIAGEVINALDGELGLYEDVYEQCCDLIDPLTNDGPYDQDDPKRPFPKSVVGTLTMLIDHWKATPQTFPAPAVQSGELPFAEPATEIAAHMLNGIYGDEDVRLIMSILRKWYADWPTQAIAQTAPAVAGEASYSHVRSDERIKRLMNNVGMPESISLFQAFKQLENEVRHEFAAPSQGSKQ